ncbi:MAG: GNAT family N-acetyltransferase [Verrucomicrobiales bacterium]|nr:GNAT family N-acetyltransferase [Verrucomicrobiales bacterium]
MLATRTMRPADFDEVAELIFLSTNAWYERHLGFSIFKCLPQDCRLFTDVYEDLDPGSALVVENRTTGMIVGSCFYHPRETHVSLGIMNVHPNYFGHGVAGRILKQIVEIAEDRDLPLRLVSSALNLDSFSLYNKFGFSPSAIYQDLFLEVPKEGIPEPDGSLPSVRPAEPSDLVAMGQIEFEVSGISRERDYCYFMENSSGLWDTVVSENEKGEVDGFLVSIDHAATKMIGPGVAGTEAAAEAMLRVQLERFCGKPVVFLLPTSSGELVSRVYSWGAKNCELHFAQVRGNYQPVNGVVMPSFLPETG